MSNITVETKELPTFIRKKHELDKLLKTLEKASPSAVKLLEDTMADEEVPLKTRIECATKIIEFHTGTVQKINADEMARLVAEVKLGSNARSKNLKLEDKPDVPELNFDDVREV